MKAKIHGLHHRSHSKTTACDGRAKYNLVLDQSQIWVDVNGGNGKGNTVSRAARRASYETPLMISLVPYSRIYSHLSHNPYL